MTLDLCLNSHEEHLQDSCVRMLVLLLLSSSLAGQNPYISPWLSQVCESWLCIPCACAARCRSPGSGGVSCPCPRGRDLLESPAGTQAAATHPSHAHEHRSWDLPQRLFDSFLSHWSPWVPMLSFKRFTMAFVKYWNLLQHFVVFYRFLRDWISKAFFVEQYKL